MVAFFFEEGYMQMASCKVSTPAASIVLDWVTAQYCLSVLYGHIMVLHSFDAFHSRHGRQSLDLMLLSSMQIDANPLLLLRGECPLHEDLLGVKEIGVG